MCFLTIKMAVLDNCRAARLLKMTWLPFFPLAQAKEMSFSPSTAAMKAPEVSC